MPLLRLPFVGLGRGPLLQLDDCELSGVGGHLGEGLRDGHLYFSLQQVLVLDQEGDLVRVASDIQHQLLRLFNFGRVENRLHQHLLQGGLLGKQLAHLRQLRLQFAL